MTTFTTNFRLKKPDFNSEGWDTSINTDLDMIDSLIGQFNTGLNIQGIWLNATLYQAGVSVVDALTGHIWILGTTYTTSNSPATFAQDRASFPTYWTDVTNPATSAAASATAAALSATAASASQTAAAASVVTAAASATAASGSATTASAAATSAAAASVAAALRGYISGLNLSNDGVAPNTKVDMSAGICYDSTNTTLITLGAFTKTISGVWVAGTGNAGMGTGLTATLGTWYHVFAIINAGVADIYFDSSVTAANKPASTTAFRRIGSIKLDASVHIIPFIQNGDKFDLVTPFPEVGGTPGNTTAHTQVLSLSPLGVVCEMLLAGSITEASTDSVFYISSLAQADVAASSSSSVTAVVKNGGFSGYKVDVMSDTASSIRYRCSSAGQTITIATLGWRDTRGRFA